MLLKKIFLVMIYERWTGRDKKKTANKGLRLDDAEIEKWSFGVNNVDVKKIMLYDKRVRTKKRMQNTS